MEGRINEVYTDFPTCLINLYLDFDIPSKKFFLIAIFNKLKLAKIHFTLKTAFKAVTLVYEQGV